VNLLAIDTATEACSVALCVGDELAERYTVAPQQHAKLVLQMVDELMTEADLKASALDGLVLGRGPGSFTGVRIAAAAVQGIALVADCPIVLISSLASMAHRAWREQQVENCVAMIDARMQQIYWACFRTSAYGCTDAVSLERVSNPDEIQLSSLPATVPGHAWLGLGSGAMAYRDKLPAEFVAAQQCSVEADQPLLPSALDMLALSLREFHSGNTVTAEHAVPTYLRDKVALTEAERKASTLD